MLSLNTSFPSDADTMTSSSNAAASTTVGKKPDLSARVMEWVDALATYSEHPDDLVVASLTPARQAVADQLKAWMIEVGFDTVSQDTAGNVIGRYLTNAHADAKPNAKPNADSQSPALVSTGGHYDTTKEGDRYEGRLGILLPMAVVGALSARGVRLPYDLEVVAFAKKEGARSDPAGLAHHFEVHIEQGPVLLNRNVPVGVVTAIAGGVRRLITLTGQAAHAGATPMGVRRDAVCAAAKALLFVERRSARDKGLVGTVGQLEVPGGAADIVPGTCRFSLDIRAVDDALRDAAVADIDEAIHEICSRREIDVESEEVLRTAATACSAVHQEAWARAIAAQGVEVCVLPLGSEHHAAKMAGFTSVSMLVVRSAGASADHPLSACVSEDDVGVAARVLEHFLLDGLGVVPPDLTE